MTTKTTKTKAKRKLQEISFDHAGAHVALTSEEQGGAANGYKTVLMKSKLFSPELIEKAQEIRVTMQLPDFLRTFFNLYGSDADVLARMMGYEPEEQDEYETYEDYIQSKLDSFEILKSLHEAEDDIADVLSDLDDEDILSVLKDQESLEKTLEEAQEELEESATQVVQKESAKASSEVSDKEVQKTSKTPVKEAPEKASQAVAKTNKPKVKQKEVEMTDKTKETAEEVVAKAQFESIQKQFEDQKVELQKALDAVAAFKAEKLETISKARFAALSEVIAEEKDAKILFKALSLVESDEEFIEVLDVLKAQKAAVEQSELFVEKGAGKQTDDQGKGNDALVKLLKSKYNQTKGA